MNIAFVEDAENDVNSDSAARMRMGSFARDLRKAAAVP